MLISENMVPLNERYAGAALLLEIFNECGILLEHGSQYLIDGEGVKFSVSMGKILL